MTFTMSTTEEMRTALVDRAITALAKGLDADERDIRDLVMGEFAPEEEVEGDGDPENLPCRSLEGGTNGVLIHGDCRQKMLELSAGSVDAICDSPPYPGGARQYGNSPEEVGRGTLDDWLEEMRQYRQAGWHALADTGTMWTVIGDRRVGSGGAGGDFLATGGKSWNSQARSKYRPGVGFEHLKDRQWSMAPELFAIEAQFEGWHVVANIVWDKLQNERIALGHAKRPKSRTERIIVLSKSPKYFWNVEEHQALPESDRGDVWYIRPKRPKDAARHFAPYPYQIAERAVRLSTKPGMTVLDPFHGSGTTGQAAANNGRHYIGIELY